LYISENIFESVKTPKLNVLIPVYTSITNIECNNKLCNSITIIETNNHFNGLGFEINTY